LYLDLLVPGSAPDQQENGTHCQGDDGDPKKKKRDFFGREGWGFMLHSVLWDAARALRGRFFG
jgi:hypothetical protein